MKLFTVQTFEIVPGWESGNSQTRHEILASTSEEALQKAEDRCRSFWQRNGFPCTVSSRIANISVELTPEQVQAYTQYYGK